MMTTPRTNTVFKTVALTVLLVATASISVAQNATLTVSTANSPYGRMVVEKVAGEALRRMGVTLHVLAQPPQRALESANSGRTDGEGPRIAGLERKYSNLRRVTEPLLTIDFMAFARPPTPEVRQWSDLVPFRVTYPHGWKVFEEKAHVAKSVLEANNHEQMFRLLVQKRVDIVLFERVDATVTMRKLDLQGVEGIEPPLVSRSMYLYLHSSNNHLIEPMSEQLRAMKADGTYDRLLREIRNSL